MVTRTSDQLRHWTRSLNRGLFKLETLENRRFDGVVVNMQQAGEHWTRYMLSLVLAKLYDLPPPSHLEDVSIVGRPIYPQIPHILIIHGAVPHYLFRSRTFFRLLHMPRHLILVRDIRDTLVSHYEKRKDRYDVDFSTYLRGDPSGKTYRPNIWTRIRFLNGWGAVAERHPEQVAVLKYEDLKADTRGQLARVCDHFSIAGVSADLLDEVVAASSKSEMAKLPEQNKESIVIRTDARPADEWYSDEDRRFVAEVCRRNLKYAFGYRYC